MTESDPDPKRTEQFLRAATAKTPHHDKFVNHLRDAKRVAREDDIPGHQVRAAIREVFGEEEPATIPEQSDK